MCMQNQIFQFMMDGESITSGDAQLVFSCVDIDKAVNHIRSNGISVPCSVDGFYITENERNRVRKEGINV